VTVKLHRPIRIFDNYLRSQGLKRNPAKLIRNLVLFLAGLIILFPIYWMINLSFQTAEQIFSLTPVWFPLEPVLTWYERVFKVANFHRPLINSLVVSIASTGCVLILSTMARLRFPLRRALYLFIISTMMIPEQVQMIPRYLMTLRFHWTNTYHGLFVPYLGGPFGIFLLAQFMQSIPREFEEAAKIDGANHIQILIRIILPLSKGPLLTLGILEFLGNWNSFLWPLIAINSDEMRTVAIEVFFLGGKTTGPAELGMVLVGAVLATIPVLLIYFVFQRQIVGSLGHLKMKG
jgi:ABC-type glycerol-3-phosphate transport system permease component